jgi:hypothetical protein
MYARDSTSAASAAATGIGKVHLDTSAIEVLFVETIDGRISLLGGPVGNESEAARTPG